MELFLTPRLRIFFSADIVGSTSLKQQGMLIDNERIEPLWASVIQGFYIQSNNSFKKEWSSRKSQCDPRLVDCFYGEDPCFWKSIGDEVLFTKIITDYRQVSSVVLCWIEVISQIRKFVQKSSPSLNVKCSAWLAEFPIKNKEVVVRTETSHSTSVESYIIANGELLNEILSNPKEVNSKIDYVGPSIDTGFRVSSRASSRRMAISVDLAYVISITMPGNVEEKIPIFFSGSEPLKGVLKGAPYPNFWIDMSDHNSLYKKEDQLSFIPACSRDAVKEYCETFFDEYKNYIFRPFIYKEKANVLSSPPEGYMDKLNKIGKEYRKFKRKQDKYKEHTDVGRGKGMTDAKAKQKIESAIQFIDNKITKTST